MFLNSAIQWVRRSARAPRARLGHVRGRACVPVELEWLEGRQLLSAAPGFSPVQVGFTGDPNAAVAADFNGDGFLDAATALGGTKVGVTLGNGDGTFQYPQYIDSGETAMSTTVAVASGDLNEDGLPDLVVVNFGAANTISVLLNTSMGGELSFGLPHQFIMGSSASFVVLGDLNGDGHLDAVTTDIGGTATSSVSYRLGNGDGTFGLGAENLFYVPAGPNPVSLSLGDLNGDGKLDMAVAYAATLGPTANKVGILLNKGPGLMGPVTFTEPKFYDFGTKPIHVTLADLNGDASLDLAVTLYYNNSVNILFNDGEGNFKAKGRASYAVGENPNSVVAADFNNDGKLDLAVANEGSHSVSILLGNGNGTFRPASPQLTLGVTGQPNWAMATGDFNGDGLTDLAVPSLLPDDIGLITVLVSTAPVHGHR